MQKLLLAITLIGLSLATGCYKESDEASKIVQTVDHKEKKVVITGVTRGLGKALLKEFVHQGWTVAGCETSASAIRDLEKEYGNEHVFSTVDVTDNDAVKTWANDVVSKIGSPNILINNAGVINNPAPLWKVPAAEFNKVMTVNITGVFNILQYFIPAMIQQKKGLIINISSSSGREGEQMFAPYCASKFAIEGLTQSLAKELPAGLVVVSLDPGDGINTDMLKQAYPGDTSRFPNPETWAKKAVPYLMRMGAQDNGKSLIVPN